MNIEMQLKHSKYIKIIIYLDTFHLDDKMIVKNVFFIINFYIAFLKLEATQKHFLKVNK